MREGGCEYEKEADMRRGRYVGRGKEEWSRERRLIENGEGVAVEKEVASRNCQSAGILPSHWGGEM